jgi:hypothetical protein
MLCGDTEEAENMNCERRPEKEGKFLLQHDNARPHIGILIKETIAESGKTCSVISAVHLGPCAFRLSPVWSNEEWPLWQHFTSEDAVIMAIKRFWLSNGQNIYRVEVSMWKNKCKYLKP